MTVPPVRRGLQRTASAASSPGYRCKPRGEGGGAPKEDPRERAHEEDQAGGPENQYRHGGSVGTRTAGEGRRRAAAQRRSAPDTRTASFSPDRGPGACPRRTPPRPGCGRPPCRDPGPHERGEDPQGDSLSDPGGAQGGLTRCGDPVELFGRLPHQGEERAGRPDAEEHAEDSPVAPIAAASSRTGPAPAGRRPEGTKRSDVAPAAVHGDGEGVEDQEGPDPHGDPGRDVEPGDEAGDEPLELAPPAVRRFDAVPGAERPLQGGRALVDGDALRKPYFQSVESSSPAEEGLGGVHVRHDQVPAERLGKSFGHEEPSHGHLLHALRRPEGKLPPGRTPARSASERARRAESGWARKRSGSSMSASSPSKP